MSGHSKWAGIKHKKAIVDAQRGKAFTKVVREITVAAKIGGGSPEGNARLRLAIVKGREVNLPKDKIEQAIKKGTGDLPGVAYEETLMEGYGPGGVAIFAQVLTDNKNRTTAELRSLFAKYHGNIAGAGSVSWIFQKKGVITIKAAGATEDRLMEIVLEAGADDFSVEGELATVTTSPHALEAVKAALQRASIHCESAEVTMLPTSTMRVDDPAHARTLLHLLDALEEHDDIQHVYANFDMPDALLAEHVA